MNIYIQYNQNLEKIKVPLRKSIGFLYKNILEKLNLSVNNIVYMINNGKFLGYIDLPFDQIITNSNINNNSVIYVIINHYPFMVENLTNIISTNYNNWLYKQHSLSNIRNVLYDPVFERNELLDNQNIENFNNILLSLFHYQIPSSENSVIKKVLTINEFDLISITTFGNIVEPLYNFCPITHETFDLDTEIIILECKHYFVYNGIKKWLTENSATCPYCKKEVIIEEISKTTS